MSAETLKYLIQVDGKIDGIHATTQGIEETTRKTAELTHALKIGFGVDIVRRFTNELERVPAALQQAIDRGIEFNTVMQNAGDSIRASILAASGGMVDFNTATAESAAITDRLYHAAQRAAVPTADLARLFARTAAAANEAGISINQYETLLGEAAVAGANMNRTLGELESDLNALFAGQVSSRNTFAKALGITTEDLAAASKAGDTVDFIRSKLAAYQQEVQGTESAQQRLRNALDNTFGRVTQALFTAMEGNAENLRAAVENLNTEALTELIQLLAKATEAGTSSVAWLMQYTDAIVAIAKAMTLVLGIHTGRWLAAYAAQKLALLSSTKAIHTETAALGRNTAAHAANAAARRTGAAAGIGRGVMAAAGGPVGIAAIAAVAAHEVFMSQYVRKLERANTLRDEHNKQMLEANRSINSQIRDMSSVEDKERVRAEIIKDMGEQTKAMIAARKKGDDETVQSLEMQLRLRRSQLNTLDEIFERDAEANRQRQGAIAAEEAFLEKERQWKQEEEERLKRMADLLPRLRETRARQEFEALGDAEKSSVLGDEIGGMQSELERLRIIDTANSSLGEQQEIEAKILDLQNRIFELSTQRQQIEAGITREKDAQAAADRRAAQAAADKARSQAEAKADFIEEFQILQARASGDEELARHLERTRTMRQEIMAVVEQTGVSEEQAYHAVARRNALLEQIAHRDRASGMTLQQLTATRPGELNRTLTPTAIPSMADVLGPRLAQPTQPGTSPVPSSSSHLPSSKIDTTPTAGAIADSTAETIAALDDMTDAITTSFAHIRQTLAQHAAQIRDQRN
jgi:hypothetical protein